MQSTGRRVFKGGGETYIQWRGDAAWPATRPSVPDAASVSERAAIEADDRPPRVVFNATSRLLSPPGGANARRPTWHEAPAPPIGAPREGAGTGLPALLLGSKRRRPFIGSAGVSPNLAPVPKSVWGGLSRAPVEML